MIAPASYDDLLGAAKLFYQAKNIKLTFLQN